MKIKVNSELIMILWYEYEDHELIEEFELDKKECKKVILGDLYGDGCRKMTIKLDTLSAENYLLLGKKEYIENLYEQVTEFLNKEEMK